MRACFMGALGAVVMLWGVNGVAEEVNSPIECGGEATYFPFGYLWAPTPPRANNPIVLSFHKEAPSQTGSQSLRVFEAQTAVLAGFSAWENVTCEGRESNVPHFQLAADLHPTLDQGDLWVGNEIQSHKNVVFWDPTGANESLSSGTLAYTNVLYFGTGHSIDGDMMFNDSDFSWRTSVGGQERGCVRGAAECFDIQTVALHEAGHFLGFGHVECADAVMFPSGSGGASNVTLSSHEEAGGCAIYPPREGDSARALGEACASLAECPAGAMCLQASSGGTLYGHCVARCAAHSECGAGFVCAEIPLVGGDSMKYCAPGLRNTASDSSGNPIGDLCSPCSSGQHCQSGLCLEEDGVSVCSRACNELNQCPENYSCVFPSSGGAYCWPDDPGLCGVDTRPDLNEVCFQEGAGDSGEDLYEPCGPGLTCMGFRPRCQGREGACLLYCDTGMACPDNLTCCFGLDDKGHCMEAASDRNVGGCFDLRREGEACVSAEQSVCVDGHECVAYGELTQAKCYETCESGTCVGDERCNVIPPLCDGMSQLNICCDNQHSEPTCLPGETSSLKEVGEHCAANRECYSEQCLNYDGSSVCTRSCDGLTGVGCPDESFDCMVINEVPRCWPKVVGVPEPGPPTPAPSGCCRAMGHPLGFGDLFFSGLVWLPFAMIWFRSRRRR